MANRVFHDSRAGPRSTTRRSTTRCARSASNRSTRAAGAGAPTVRHGAGDAGRAEGADHPRLLHPAAAPVPVRGQCRGALRRARRDHREPVLDKLSLEVLLEAAAGARQRRSAARSTQPCSPPPTTLSGHGARGDPRARRAHAWLDAPAACRQRDGGAVGSARRRTRRRPLRRSRPRYSTAVCSPHRNGPRSAPRWRQARRPTGSKANASPRWRRRRRRAARHLSRYLLHQDSRQAQGADRHQGRRRQAPRAVPAADRGTRRASARCASAAAPSRRATAPPR